MSEAATETAPMLADRIFAAIRLIARQRGRLADTGHTDLAGLEDCVRAIYEGVRTAPPHQGRFLVEALVVLQSDLSALGEELNAACAATIEAARRPPHRRDAESTDGGPADTQRSAAAEREAERGGDDE
jgi:hypothetical protein